MKSSISLTRAGENHVKGKGTILTDRLKTRSSIRMIVLPEEAYKLLNKWKSVQAALRLKCDDAWEEPDAMFASETGRRLCIYTDA